MLYLGKIQIRMAPLADQISFHRELYSKAGVNAAVEAYENLATIQVAEDAEHWVATIHANDSEFQEQVMDYFANHVLHVSLADRGAM